MKIKITIGLILSALVIFFSCEKESKDYRDKYTGNWDFTVELTKVNIDSIGQYEQDSVLYSGKIIKGNTENEINIQYAESENIILVVGEFGEMSGFPTQYCSGNFEGESKIHLYLRWGGLGGNITHIVDGVKK